MTDLLTDHPSRAELIAELYDRYAAGLFAYCADQLGDHGSAADALVSVLGSAADAWASARGSTAAASMSARGSTAAASMSAGAGGQAGPPARAALFAFARREIQRRDVVYAPPAVDPLIDPASALVERVLRELRPHQREVLVLCEVCGLDRAELAWVLDVAPDTADELATSATHRYRQALDTTLARTETRVSKPVADVYGALGVAPLRDVLGRLPWPPPPASLHSHFAPQVPPGRTAAPMFVKPLWPGPPTWPQPLAVADAATSTGIFPTELLTPPSPSRVPEHEAPTAPMPKLRDPFGPGSPLEGPAPTGLAPKGPTPEGLAPEGQRFFTPRSPSTRLPGDVLSDTRSSGDALFGRRPSDDALSGTRPSSDALPSKRPSDDALFGKRPSGDAVSGSRPSDDAPSGARPVRDGLFRLPQPASEKPAPARPAEEPEPLPKRPFTLSASIPADVLDDEPITQELPAIGDILVHKGEAREPGALFVPRAAAREPIYRLPAPLPFPPTVDDLPIVDDLPEDLPEVPDLPRARVRPGKDRHHDWAWELVGFLVCVAIAMIVFFAVPLIIG
ncbi:hypothetical protein ACQP2T_10530 [Nonomuraea sp. CA-143628]|uniref:RNA polymerase sigma factor n=1 Tax=Nonomuraea sp. CA-143628 TaxID=3239997 RepID=UPI003D8C5D18